MQTGEKRKAILDFIRIHNELISAFVDNIEIYDFFTLRFIRRVEKFGSVLKRINKDNKLFCACIYDEIKVFDSNFNLFKIISTKTICYAIHLSKNKLLWASFYEKTLSWFNLDDLSMS